MTLLSYVVAQHCVTCEHDIVVVVMMHNCDHKNAFARAPPFILIYEVCISCCYCMLCVTFITLCYCILS